MRKKCANNTTATATTGGENNAQVKLLGCLVILLLSLR